jgi:hypothetical protein
VLDRIDELVDEQFTGDVNYLHVFLLGPNVLANSLHQVGLAKTDTAINEQRVVRACGRLRHGQSGGMSNFIVRTNHEGFERVPWIESGHGRAWFGFGRRLRQNFFQRCDILGRRLRASSRRRAELHGARAAERRHDRSLQCRHVITFYPKLIDVVWNAKRERFFFGLNKFDRREPAFKTVGANLWFERG